MVHGMASILRKKNASGNPGVCGQPGMGSLCKANRSRALMFVSYLTGTDYLQLGTNDGRNLPTNISCCVFPNNKKA